MLEGEGVVQDLGVGRAISALIDGRRGGESCESGGGEESGLHFESVGEVVFESEFEWY